MDPPDLNFQPGLGVQSTTWHRSSEPANFFPIKGLMEFSLVVSVGKCKFRLNEHYVGLILQATLGGTAADFRPEQLSDGVFHFVVASKDVGFHIYKLRSFVCEQYHIFFNLWGNGGSNWVQEFHNFLAEEEDQWTFVHHKNMTHKSYRDVVKGFHLLSGANRVPVGKKILQSKRVFPMHRSVLDRIDKLHRNHQKDYHKKVHSSVFNHLEWPVDRLDHQKDHCVLDSSDHRVLSQKSRRSQCFNQWLFLNSKGKRPIDHVHDSRHNLGCSICDWSSPSVMCRKSIRYHSCH
jgi:hypothetical protein